MGEYRDYVAHQAKEILIDELCESYDWPSNGELLVENCPDQIGAQLLPIGLLAERFTKRVNYGLFSLYVTNIKGGNLPSFLSVPSFSVKTLAIARIFIPLDGTVHEGVD